MRVLNIEDNPIKQAGIKRALQWNGISEIEDTDNMEDGIRMIQESAYDLLVLDMQFPLRAASGVDVEAGLKTMKRLQELKINVPIIICSADRLNIPDVAGCIYYSQNTDLEMEFRKLMEKLRAK